MKDRTEEDFSGVIADLIFNISDIVAVPDKVGVYHNPNAKAGFQYAIAFAIVDEEGCTWVETFGVEKNDTKFTLRGRWGSSHMGKGPSADDVTLEASEMVNTHLSPH